jgi:hypothetical protein
VKWAASLTAALLLVASCESEHSSRTRVPPGRGDSLAGRVFLSTERVGALATTEIGCDPERHAQDD